MREIKIKKVLPQIKLKGNIYEISREVSGRGYQYIFSTPIENHELPREIYIFQVYSDNRSRGVIAFDTPFCNPNIRNILKSKLEGCVKEFMVCGSSCNMPCER